MSKRDICKGCGEIGDCTSWINMTSYTVRYYCPYCAAGAKSYGQRPYGLIARIKRLVRREPNATIISEMPWILMCGVVLVVGNCYATGIIGSIGIVAISMWAGRALSRPA